MSDKTKALARLLKLGWSKEGSEFLASKVNEWSPIMRRKILGEKTQKKTACVRCGYKGPALDLHHVHGRKHSSKTVVLCANCHREVHAGEPLKNDERSTDQP